MLSKVAIGLLAAGLVGVTLAGATARVLAAQVPVERHRCQCRGHPGGECECPECRRAAQEALSERPSAGFDAAGIGCACGEPGEPTTAPVAVEPCCLPADRVVAAADRTESRRREEVDLARDGPVEPETPPPIGA